MNKSKAKQLVADAQAKLAEAQKALEDCKPELRHGDYGIGNGYPRLVLCDKDMCLYTAGSHHCEQLGCDNNSPDPVLGNIFDDLKLQAEDLRNWDSEESVTGKRFTVKVDRANQLWIGNIGDSSYYAIDVAEKIAHKILQGVATLRRNL